ncbi:MAG: hypothetical protein IAA85_05180 [Firmicutes bacterium]|nr:hypothetical protein [Candidatus Alectryobacillus merdavium]
MFFVNIFRFFTGRKLLGILKEDFEAQEIINKANQKEQEEVNKQDAPQTSQPTQEVKQQIINNYIFTNPKDLQNLNLNPNTNQIENSNPPQIENAPINQIEQKNDVEVVSIQNQEDIQDLNTSKENVDDVDKEVSQQLQQVMFNTNQDNSNGENQ